MSIIIIQLLLDMNFYVRRRQVRNKSVDVTYPKICASYSLYLQESVSQNCGN